MEKYESNMSSSKFLWMRIPVMMVLNVSILTVELSHLLNLMKSVGGISMKKLLIFIFMATLI